MGAHKPDLSKLAQLVAPPERLGPAGELELVRVGRHTHREEAIDQRTLQRRLHLGWKPIRQRIRVDLPGQRTAVLTPRPAVVLCAVHRFARRLKVRDRETAEDLEAEAACCRCPQRHRRLEGEGGSLGGGRGEEFGELA